MFFVGDEKRAREIAEKMGLTPVGTVRILARLNQDGRAFSSYGGSAAVFDSSDDLSIADLDRARVLVYRRSLWPREAPRPSASPRTG